MSILTYIIWLMFTSGITYAILTAIALGVWTFSHDMVAQEVHNIVVGAVCISFIGVVLGLILLLMTGNINQLLEVPTSISTRSLVFIGVAGVCVLLIDAFALKAYQLSPNISIIAPIIMSGSVLVSTFIGMLFLSEAVTLYKIFGIIASMIGILLLSL